MGSTVYQQRARNLTLSKRTWRQPPPAWLTESPGDALCQAASLPCKHRAGLSSSQFFAFSFALRFASVSPLVGGIRAHVSLLVWSPALANGILADTAEGWTSEVLASCAPACLCWEKTRFLCAPEGERPRADLTPGAADSPRPSLQTRGPDIRAYVVVVRSTGH